MYVRTAVGSVIHTKKILMSSPHIFMVNALHRKIVAHVSRKHHSNTTEWLQTECVARK